jgi:alcohol dehydrogenase class IV
MESFTFSRTPRLVAGAGSYLRYLDELTASGVSDVVLVSGAHWFAESEFSADVEMRMRGSRLRRFMISGEPTAPFVDSVARELRSETPELLLAVGGGSVLDASKAIAAMACESGSVEEYLEGIGTRKLSGRRITLAVVPTTAGTGAEATKNAVISRVGEGGYKSSLRHDALIPDVAVLDPALSVGCPRRITADSGLDAVTQLIEAYVSTGASIFTEAIAREGLTAAASPFPKLLDEPSNLATRFEMSFAAYLSGVALANAGLGVVHGLASPLGAIREVAHGAVCAALIAPATRYVVRKLLESDSPGVGLAKYAEVGRILTGMETDSAGTSDEDATEALCTVLDVWTARSRVRSLSALGFTGDDLVAAGVSASGRNTPCPLDGDDITSILELAYTTGAAI